MLIGEKLNKFDLQTTGTVKDFNEVFPECPLSSEYSPESIVEVGGIVGVGQVTKRFLWVDEKLTEHLFERERYFVPVVRKKNKKIVREDKKSYKAIEIATGKEYFASTNRELSNKIGVTARSLNNFINKGSAKLDYKFIIEVTTNGETTRIEPPAKPKFKVYEYTMVKGSKTFTFYMVKDIARVLRVNHKKVTQHILSGELLKGFKITRRKLDGNNSKI